MAKGPSKQKPAADAAGGAPPDSMAVLVHDVAPLRAPERVGRVPDRPPANRAPRSRASAASRRTFVLERDGDRVHGYRSDCAVPSVAPGSHRDWVPLMRVDLHGVRIRELDERLSQAMRDCVQRSGFRLLLIHGKGLHSAGGASVLAEAVVERLTSERHARYVRAFSTAPERLGGTGALAVDLDVEARRHR